MRRKSTAAVVTCFEFLTLLVSFLYADDSPTGDRTVTVMTRNLDAGSDFGYVP